MKPAEIDLLIIAPQMAGLAPDFGHAAAAGCEDENAAGAFDQVQQQDQDHDPVLAPTDDSDSETGMEAGMEAGPDLDAGALPADTGESGAEPIGGREAEAGEPSGDDQASIIVLEAGEAVEFVPQWEKGRLRKHDIVLGVVRRPVPHLGGVFVQIGGGHDGLLRLAADEPIPNAGSRVVAMVARESRAASQTGGADTGPAMADKGPLLTRKLAIAGRYAVLRPGQWPLRRTVLQSLPSDEAERCFNDNLQQLETRYAAMLQAAASGPAPRVLMAAGDPLLVLAHAYGSRLRSIRVEGIDRFRRVEQLLREAAPDLLPRLQLHPPHFTHGLASMHRVSDLARQACRRQVRLPCGGTLVFDRTEALHVIDVNSGVCRDRSPDALADRVNREAVREIARQLRLRNLSGMVIVDLIHQKDASRREAHAAALREATARDRGAVTVYGFTALGLLELIRKAH